MTITEIKQCIQNHAGHLHNQSDIGLVGSLRPFAGLSEAAFASLLNAIFEWRQTLDGAERIDREIVFALWDICRRCRQLALVERSLLSTNKIISEAELLRLKTWVDIIETASIRTLQGQEAHLCFSRLFEYLAGCQSCDLNNYLFVSAMLPVAKSDSDNEIRTDAENLDRAMRRTIR